MEEKRIEYIRNQREDTLVLTHAGQKLEAVKSSDGVRIGLFEDKDVNLEAVPFILSLEERTALVQHLQ